MSKQNIFLIIFFTLSLSSASSFSQTIRDSNSRLIVKIANGDIRDSSSRKLGSINYEGVVRNSTSQKLGTIKNGKVLNDNGVTIFKYDDSGTIRDSNGRLIYRISNGDIRNSSSKLLFKYEDIKLTYLMVYLCFFNADYWAK